MRKLSFVAFLFAYGAFASPMSVDDVSSFLHSWVGSGGDSDGSPVVSVSPYERGGKVLFYVARRESGAAVFLSPDDRVYPVIAMSERVFDGSGNVLLDKGHPLFDILEGTMSNTVRRLSALMATRTDEYSRNREEWGRFIGKPAKMARASLKASASDNLIGGAEYVLPGFETGGVLTHWNQTTASKDFSGNVPLYNYYMLSSSIGGAGEAGLDQHVEFASQFPCGCVATALAAAAQYHGFTGVVDSPTYYNTVTVETTGGTTGFSKYLVPGEYDWSVLPSNYGGSAPECRSDSSFPQAARELIGRVAYNYGIVSRMNYANMSSGASTPLRPDMTDGFVTFTANLRDHAHVNKGGFLTSREISNPVEFSRALEVAIRLGEPVVMQVRGSQGGHCILAVGVRGASDFSRYVKVFMGWSGSGDTWFYGGGTTVGTMFTSIDGGDVTGGVGHPTKFTWVEYGGVDTGMGATVLRPLNIECSTSFSIVSNAAGTVFGIGHKFAYSSENGPGPGTLSSTLRFSVDPFTYNGVLLSPSSYSSSWAHTYEFVGAHPSKYVYLGIGGKNFSTETSVNLTAEGSKAYGFPHGTPETLADVAYASFTNNVPLVVVSGVDGSPDPVVVEFKTGQTHSKLSSATVYFIDTASDRTDGIVDWRNSYMVFDPFRAIDSSLWDSDNPGRLAYGTFTSPSEVLSVVSNGLARYSALPMSRANDHGMDWYRHPKIDTNPHVVPPSTTSLDLNSVRGMGYTSVTASGITSFSRSNVSSADTTIKYVDFTGCPATSSSAQMFRTFRGLVTASGLPSGFTSVPSWCFASCESLTTLSGLSPSVTALSQGAFYGCTSLKSVGGLPPGVTAVGNQCFQNCTSLANTDGISGVLSMGSDVFSFMSSSGGGAPFSITEWPSEVHYVPDSTFSYRSGLTSLSGLPDHVTSYGDYAFSSTGLTTLDGASDSVESFGARCFQSCQGLVSVPKLPSSLSSIGQACFQWCQNLSMIDFTGVDVGSLSIGSSAFSGAGSSATTFVLVFPATKSAVMSMSNYSSWGLPSGKTTIRCTDGDINL